MTQEQYGAMFTKYINLARQVGWRFRKKYGNIRDWISEAESALALVIMQKGHLFAAVNAAETTCIVSQIQWRLLDLTRRQRPIPQPIHQNIPDKREQIFLDLPKDLSEIVTKILEDPEGFQCRPGVIFYKSTPVCKYLMRNGMAEREAIQVQQRLEECFV